MGPHLNAVAAGIKQIVDNLRAADITSLGIGIVAYRDLDIRPTGEDPTNPMAGGPMEMLPMKRVDEAHFASLTDFTAKLKPNGHGNKGLPEDVCGGLRNSMAMLDASVAPVKAIIMFADAPCHGRMFHDL